RMDSTSRSISVSETPGLIRLSTRRADSTSRVLVINQRGLSGRPKHRMVYRRDGNAATAIIHLLALGPTSASIALVAYAMTIPKTILNWNIPANRPRYFGGAISAMYRGAATVDIPMPNPPITRAAIKE